MSDAEKVRAAADYIERVGLHKGGLSAWVGDRYDAVRDGRAVAAGIPCCTLGALYAFCGESRAWVLRDDFLDHVGTAESVGGWNDAEERTADEVVAALRSFADSLEADVQSG
jgi:hypothetical protein